MKITLVDYRAPGAAAAAAILMMTMTRMIVLDQKCDAASIGIEGRLPQSDNGEDDATPPLEDAAFWRNIGQRQLQRTIEFNRKHGDTSYLKKAKNIIIIIGDGMGMTTITAGRIHKGQQSKNDKKRGGEEAMLAFDMFPYSGLAKTYNVDRQVADSASTATAMFCGVKTFHDTVGLDVTRDKWNAEQGRLRSIMQWAQDAGKRTGIVTTTRITHATPAATYAGIYDRNWECDTEIPIDVQRQNQPHIDIARQLIEFAPGNRFNVILGGGLSPMGALNPNEIRTVQFAGPTEIICERADGRNLTAEWLQIERKTNNDGDNKSTSHFVQTRDQLLKLNATNVDYLLGLFRNNHLTYAIAAEPDEPKLSEMVEKAIGVLDRSTRPPTDDDDTGYVLMIEGGRIDQAHHQNYARAALREVLELDKAIDVVRKLTNDNETLIIVTADHSHAMTLNGYPRRGNDILGFANKTTNIRPYETLTYANGPGYYQHLNPNILQMTYEQLNKSVWLLPNGSDHVLRRSQPTYRHLATLPIKDETHGGEDVPVYGVGPGASLIRGVFEQNYLAFVMSYVGCIGPAKDIDETCKMQMVEEEKSSSSDTSSFSSGGGVFVVFFSIFFFM